MMDHLDARFGRVARIVEELYVYASRLQETLAHAPLTWDEKQDQWVVVNVLVCLTLKSILELVTPDVQAIVEGLLAGREVVMSRCPSSKGGSRNDG
jgi:hypothetical protein